MSICIFELARSLIGLNLVVLTKKFNYKVVALENLCGLKKKVSKLLFSFKSYEHLYFRARSVTNRVKFGGFDNKLNYKAVSLENICGLKKKVSKLLFSFQTYEHLYFRACPVNNRVKFGGFDKKFNYKVVALENLCGLKKKSK